MSDELVKIDKRVPARPQIALDAPALAEIADPKDTGPIAELMALMAETVSLALGPSLASLNLGKRERIDPRGGHPLRVAVSEWMGALGFGDFDIYIGGPDPEGVSGVAGEQPALVRHRDDAAHLVEGEVRRHVHDRLGEHGRRAAGEQGGGGQGGQRAHGAEG